MTNTTTDEQTDLELTEALAEFARAYRKDRQAFHGHEKVRDPETGKIVARPLIADTDKILAQGWAHPDR